MHEPKENLEDGGQLGDWRLAKVGRVLAIDGQPTNSAAVFCQVSHFASGTESWSFPTPSAASLHMSNAWAAAADAARLAKLVHWTTSTSPNGAHRQISQQDPAALFDLLQALVVVTMSSYAAVEAFSNSVLADRMESPVRVKHRGRQTDFTSIEDAERYLTTEEKVKGLLPKLLDVPTPAGRADLWAPFKRLQELRDSVTHFKRKDQARRAHEDAEPTVLHVLAVTDPFDLPESALRLIRYYAGAPSATSRWAYNPTWSRPSLAA